MCCSCNVFRESCFLVAVFDVWDIHVAVPWCCSDLMSIKGFWKISENDWTLFLVTKTSEQQGNWKWEHRQRSWNEELPFLIIWFQGLSTWTEKKVGNKNDALKFQSRCQLQDLTYFIHTFSCCLAIGVDHRPAAATSPGSWRNKSPKPPSRPMTLTLCFIRQFLCPLKSDKFCPGTSIYDENFEFRD